MEAHLFLNCSLTLEQHLHQELVRQTTQSCIRTSEPLKVRVRRRLVMKQQFFILHSEQHLLVELVHKHLKKRAHSSELLQLLLMVLQHQKNCEPSLEVVRHQDSPTHMHYSDTEN
jgi:hypothetical protein